MGIFPSKNQFPVDGRTVLVTGGSQGMGRSVARLLAQKGANVVIAARNVQRLEEALEHIASGAAPALPPLPSSSMLPSPVTNHNSKPTTSPPSTSPTPPFNNG
ncbi:MAG: hypothetical protein Q9172_005515 [Xanthocarpia lactea]